jgi:hypothetical protein
MHFVHHITRRETQSPLVNDIVNVSRIGLVQLKVAASRKQVDRSS